MTSTTKTLATMTAGELADRLGWDAVEDLALGRDVEVAILSDGTVNALERGALVADVAHLSSMDMDMLIEGHECIYCGAHTPKGAAPAATDDEAWQALARLHGDTCEWAQTRAHQVSRD